LMAELIATFQIGSPWPSATAVPNTIGAGVFSADRNNRYA
jgi:hypothetical protein